MNDNLLQKLKDWRKDTAQKEGVDFFRVLSNSAIEAIASLKPKAKEELISIKGIKERKFEKYGATILALVSGSENESSIQKKAVKNKPYTISEYLNFLNAEFKRYKSCVQGEISSIDVREGYLFFSLKDKDNKSVLPCFMWRSNYELCGISLEVGMEVIVNGFPEIYAPSGRFNFRVSTVELIGEGTLKKAYDQLRQKLEKEGLFSPERKKIIPEFPQRIGLITSESGAVIHDFLNNLGKYGYHISFINSRVEGQIAVRSLISAIGHFNSENIDVLVIIRGGGSLESLQAFNNEVLVRKIADFKAPVICGIGHDKDIPLASLAADKKVSTPTAVTTILNRSWEKVVNDISATEKDIIYKYQRMLDASMYRIESFSGDLMQYFNEIFQTFENLRCSIENNLSRIAYALKDAKKTLSLLSQSLLNGFRKELEYKNSILTDIEKQLKVFDPVRQLALGYSIVSAAGKVVKTTKQVSIGNELNIRVSDGTIGSIINKIKQ